MLDVNRNQTSVRNSGLSVIETLPEGLAFERRH